MMFKLFRAKHDDPFDQIKADLALTKWMAWGLYLLTLLLLIKVLSE